MGVGPGFELARIFHTLFCYDLLRPILPVLRSILVWTVCTQQGGISRATTIPLPLKRSLFAPLPGRQLEDSRREFFHRLGFEHSLTYGIEIQLPDWAPAEAAQIVRLWSFDARDPTLRGTVVYPAAFDDPEG